MDARVANCAVLVARIGHIVRRRLCCHAVRVSPKLASSVVTLQAHREGYRSLQKPRVCRTVRNVAGLAPFYTDCRMLVEKWSALIDVALKARFLVADGLIHHARPSGHVPCGRERPVRVVAISTLDRSFVYAVLEWHRELRAHSCMTAVASIALLGCLKQILGCGRSMNGMAIRANYIG